jgi:hypothetical protein
LNDIQIQALADGEGDRAAATHAAGCARCGERVQARRALMSAIERSIDVPVPLPMSTARNVEQIFRARTEAMGTQTGATRMLTREPGGLRLHAEGRRRWLYGGLGVAAATILAVLVVAPAMRTPESTVSASEILAKSANQLSAAVTGGIELLEYQLVLDGVPKEMMPDGADGTYRVQQAIDHSVPGRFRFSTFGSDGALLKSIAEDPRARHRVIAFSVDKQPYRFDVSLPSANAGMSLPEMERLHMEASIAMMQASGNQLVETIDGPHGKLYRIGVPRVSAPGTSPVWDLTEARVLIDARDYRVTEFAVSGSFLKQAYSLSYKLISHSVVSSVPADTFSVPAQPGQIVITGEGSHVPTHDVVVLSLRELTKLKQAQ